MGESIHEEVNTMHDVMLGGNEVMADDFCVR